MKLIITGRNFTVTDALKEHAHERASTLKRYFDNIIEVDVILSVDKRKKPEKRHAEVNLWASGTQLHSKESGPDMYQCINGAVARIERQLKRYKERLKENRHRTGRQQKDERAALAVENHLYEAIHSVVDLEDEGPRIVRSNKFAIKPMSVEEAALQLEALKQQFVVFSNAETNAVNVVYRRSDGSVGLIEPPPRR